jgi:hypothetical protein
LLCGSYEGEEVGFLSPDSVLDSFKSFSETHASSPVVVGIGDDDPDDQPAVQEEVPPP